MAIDLIAVRARIAPLTANAGGLLLKGVSGVLNAAQAMDTPARPPWAFVGMASETAQPNRTQGVHDQKVDSVVSVLLCLAQERRDGAEQLTDAAEETRMGVITALAGWTAPGARTAFDYQGHRVLAMQDGIVWLEEAFMASWTLRVVPAP